MFKKTLFHIKSTMNKREIYQAVKRNGEPGRYYFLSTGTCVPNQTIKGQKGESNPNFNVNKYSVVPRPENRAASQRVALVKDGDGLLPVRQSFTTRDVIELGNSMGLKIAASAASQFYRAYNSLEEVCVSLEKLMMKFPGRDIVSFSNLNKQIIMRSTKTGHVDTE